MRFVDALVAIFYFHVLLTAVLGLYFFRLIVSYMPISFRLVIFRVICTEQVLFVYRIPVWWMCTTTYEERLNGM